jgi:hypothetical protein
LLYKFKPFFKTFFILMNQRGFYGCFDMLRQFLPNSARKNRRIKKSGQILVWPENFHPLPGYFLTQGKLAVIICWVCCKKCKPSEEEERESSQPSYKITVLDRVGYLPGMATWPKA